MQCGRTKRPGVDPRERSSFFKSWGGGGHEIWGMYKQFRLAAMKKGEEYESFTQRVSRPKFDHLRDSTPQSVTSTIIMGP